MRIFKILVLAISACALFYASSTRLMQPWKASFIQTYEQNPYNNLEDDLDLLSEIRGVGAVMILGGLVVLFGISFPRMQSISFTMAGIIFTGVASGRLISMGVDGIPNPAIFQAAIAEIVLSVLNLYCLLHVLLWEESEIPA